MNRCAIVLTAALMVACLGAAHARAGAKSLNSSQARSQREGPAIKPSKGKATPSALPRRQHRALVRRSVLPWRVNFIRRQPFAPPPGPPPFPGPRRILPRP